MHLLLIHLRDNAQPISLKFDSKADAEHQWARVNETPASSDDENEWDAWIIIEDDYGHRRRLDRYDLRSVALIDCDADIRGNVQMTLLNQRGQISAQRLAAADPTLQLATGPQPNGMFRQ